LTVWRDLVRPALGMGPTSLARSSTSPGVPLRGHREATTPPA